MLLKKEVMVMKMLPEGFEPSDHDVVSDNEVVPTETTC